MLLEESMSLWKSPNTVTQGGRLVKDPDIRQMQSGTAICTFTLANNRMLNKEGVKSEDSHFFDMKAYGKTAENIAQYFHKGDPITIEGELRQDRWEDKETGQTRTKVCIVVDKWYFPPQSTRAMVQDRTGHQPQGFETKAPPAPARPPAPAAPAGFGSDEDDSIPF